MKALSRKTLERIKQAYDAGYSEEEIRKSLKKRYPLLEDEVIEKYIQLGKSKISYKDLDAKEKNALRKEKSFSFKKFLGMDK